MLNRTSNRAGLSICLVVAIFATYSMVGLAAPTQPQTKLFGDLTVSGQVTVDSQSTISGATFFPDSTITTGENSNAIVSFSAFGRIQYSSNSSSKLGLTDTGTAGALDAGRVCVSKPQGVSATFTTKDGSVAADTNQLTVFTVDVTNGNTVVAAQQGRVELRANGSVKMIAAGQTGTAGSNQPGGNARGNGLDQKQVVEILSGIGAVIAGIIAIINGTNGTTPVSPMR